MFLEAEMHTAYEFGNAPIREFPYPHFYIRDVFPDEFYRQMLAHLPATADLSPIEEKRPVKGYKERFVYCFDDESLAGLPAEKSAFWRQFRDTWQRGAFGNLLVSKFQSLIDQRLKGNPNIEFYDELMLVHDIQNYTLGPHTDSPKKLITVVFYLPADDRHASMGTCIYLPRDGSFSCPGGPHYKHERFVRVKSMPYVPNSVFCFFKTDNSFHGVEKLDEEGYGRWLLLYDIYMRPKQAVAAPGAPVSGAAPSVRFF